LEQGIGKNELVKTQTPSEENVQLGSSERERVRALRGSKEKESSFGEEFETYGPWNKTEGYAKVRRLRAPRGAETKSTRVGDVHAGKRHFGTERNRRGCAAS